MEQNHLDRALKKIFQFSAHFNQYFQHKEPWKNNPGTNSCIYLSVNAVRSLAIAIYPFLPESSQKIWIQLGMHDNISTQGFDEISNISIKQGHKLGKISPLFQKVEESRVKRLFGSLTRNSQIEKVNVWSINGDFEFNLKEVHSFSYGFEATYNDIHSRAFQSDLIVNDS